MSTYSAMWADHFALQMAQSVAHVRGYEEMGHPDWADLEGYRFEQLLARFEVHCRAELEKA